MKIHMRFDRGNPEHQYFTLFVNGKNTGQLCMSPNEAGELHMILSHALDMPNDEFVSSGKPYIPENQR